MPEEDKILVTIQQETSIIDIISISLSAIMLLVTIIGVIGLYNLRIQQRKACYGFYLNLLAHIEILKQYLILGGQIPTWCTILGLDYATRIDNEHKDDLEKADNVAKYAKQFILFLQNSSNQVPPFIRKKKRRKWNEHFEVLRKNLIIFSLWRETGNSYIEWKSTNIVATYNALIKSINFIENAIKKKINKR